MFPPWGSSSIGLVVFLVFACILEQAVHFVVLKANPVTAAFFKNPFAYAVYGAAAGLFEECGRFCAYKTVLKKYRRWQDGIGHGGFEMLFLGVLSAINSIVIAVSINSGDSLPQTVVKAMQGPSYLIGVSIYERCVAFCFQIGLSLVVLYGVANHKNRFLLYAILFHMASDFFAALCQAQVLSVWAAELALLPFGALGIVLILFAKRIFSKGIVSEKQAVKSI